VEDDLTFNIFQVKEYRIKEIFFSLAGEGVQAGRATVFVRFSGCNLWSGREEDRTTAKCKFCDTDFNEMNGLNGGRYSLPLLMDVIEGLWGERSGRQPYVVFTGGEPSLQLDAPLLKACQNSGFETGIETNGTRDLVPGIDWVCVSPKGNEPLKVKFGHELKLVYPQLGVDIDPRKFASLDFENLFIQPLWTPKREFWSQAIDYCLANPEWKLSLQSHKVLGLP
jgi:7-carboxy-7-deazaguanine synthase (Cx14CxxC type)